MIFIDFFFPTWESARLNEPHGGRFLAMRARTARLLE